jgi:hypothetical protein
MVFENTPPRQTTAHAVARSQAEGSYLDWSAALAGAVFALAVSVLLISFGAGLGLSLTSPYRGEGVSAAWLAIASGIWFAWVMVTGFGAGGYLAGRLRRKFGDATADEVGVRDGAHGLMVWAVGALVGMVLAATGVGGMLSAGASAAGSATNTAANLASDAASSDYFANVMLRTGEDRAETGPDAAEAAGSDATPAAVPATAQGGAAPANIDPGAQQQIASILLRGVTDGDMVARDRNYLAQLVAANTNLDPAASLARVDEINAEIADARRAALDAVEEARVAGVVFGFIAAATLLIGAIAAFFAATAGGRHRDEGLGFDMPNARN